MTATRAHMIEVARGLNEHFAEGIEGPGKFDRAGDRELAAALLTISLAGGVDAQAGSVMTGLWLGRIDHFVVSESDLGSVDSEECESVEEAQAVLDALTRDQGAGDDDD